MTTLSAQHPAHRSAGAVAVRVAFPRLPGERVGRTKRRVLPRPKRDHQGDKAYHQAQARACCARRDEQPDQPVRWVLSLLGEMWLARGP